MYLRLRYLLDSARTIRKRQKYNFIFLYFSIYGDNTTLYLFFIYKISGVSAACQQILRLGANNAISINPFISYLMLTFFSL